MEHSTPQRRRSFKIKTKFGSARQWRSRKNPPCDACRRRKTACIIETSPPCRFCRSKGQVCTSTDIETGPSRQGPRDTVVESDQDTTDSTVDASYLSIPPLTSPGIESESFGIPLIAQTTSPSYRSASVAASLTSPGAHLPNSTPRSDNGPVVDTLEDNENRTAHSVGLSGEQDTDLLASFRSFITNERDGVSADVIQAFAGDLEVTAFPIHFNLLTDEFQPADDVAKSRISDAIESMVSPHASTLVRLFFKHVHPVYCVVSKGRFLKAYSQDKTKIPASLRGAIYGLGSTFWQHDSDVEGTLHFDLHTLFEEAQSSLQREFHAPDLWTIQACLLLLYERAADNATIETPRTWVFSSHTVSCAHMAGLHRDCSTWHLVPGEKKLRRKLWWATYMSDIWSSVCHGNPPLVYPGSFTTAPPSIDDLAFDEDVPADLQHMVDLSSRTADISTSARFLEMVKLSQILHELIDSYFLDSTYQQTIVQPQLREAKLLNIRQDLENWSSMVPNCVTMAYNGERHAFRNNGPLNLAYFAVQALLFRALMSPARMSAKTDPTSSLCRYFDSAVAEFRSFTLFMDRITRVTLHAFWGGHARSQLTLCGNFLIYLFLLAPSPEQVHPAFELLGSFHESLQRLREWADDDPSLALLRPVALRIDSFFLHAARIMRNGMAGQGIVS
ncbi:fungal-specific transcription factor domain-containing protein [Aspergillus pseudodeflectus]|uniref:Fungal-specific transcription factor domain-containing protein n=1 Tax=Aspergillus pseudodeflectus TaxID=176178 RepID=A0ABR4KBP9_9EURO